MRAGTPLCRYLRRLTLFVDCSVSVTSITQTLFYEIEIPDYNLLHMTRVNGNAIRKASLVVWYSGYVYMPHVRPICQSKVSNIEPNLIAGR